MLGIKHRSEKSFQVVLPEHSALPNDKTRTFLTCKFYDSTIHSCHLQKLLFHLTGGPHWLITGLFVYVMVWLFFITLPGAIIFLILHSLQLMNIAHDRYGCTVCVAFICTFLLKKSLEYRWDLPRISCNQLPPSTSN